MLFLLPLLLVAATALAQSRVLSGTVRDDAGVIRNATVTISTAGTQVSNTTTDADGKYEFSGLHDGRYEVTVSLEGFETAVRQVALDANTGALDFRIGVGRVSTTVTVTAAAGRATASRLPISNNEIPSQVSSISQELLRQQAINTVGDALKNASGVQAFRWYGAYEQYTIRGFSDPDRDSFNVMLVDGMRRGGNRYGTQTNNIESVEVLKGPSSILYGRGAVGGAINIIRKKPQALRASELSYRGGRFNTNQFAGGTTGAITDRLWYRFDSSFEHSAGWRKAGADRLNVSPSLTWVVDDHTRVTLYQQFVRDRFDGDGGVPLNIVSLPNFRPDLRFSLPQDNVLVEDSMTQALLSRRLSTSWEFRNSLQVQRTSDRYFVTEGVYGSPEENLVYREPLDFHHIRRPLQNQAEVLGRVEGFGGHNLLFGYEFQRDKYRTEVTAGDDPDCLCGYWAYTIAPIDITTLEETQAPLDLDTVERTTFVNDRTQSFYWQDQIDVTSRLKINIAGRFDDYKRNVDRTGGLPFTSQRRDQTAYTYRGGAVYVPRPDHQIYFGAASAFTPVTTIPANGAPLEPSTSRSVEAGHRWQGWGGRVDTSLAVYHIVRNNVNISQTPTTVLQIGEQRSNGLDLDVNADLGRRTYIIVNYGFTSPVYKDAGTLSGLAPRFAPRHLTNVWLRKEFANGFNAAFGARGVGTQFVDNANTTTLDAYTIFSGAAGYRTERWELSLNADNLFNKEDYFLPGHFSNNVFPGQPLNIVATLRVKWY